MKVIFTGVNGTSIVGAPQPLLTDVLMQNKLPGNPYFPDPSQM